MYKRTFWVDDTPIEPGTLIDQDHLNNMEEGIFEAHEMSMSAIMSRVQAKRDIEGVKGLEVTKTLTNSQTYPFNNSKTTVALPALRNNNGYYVVVETVSATDGAVGEFIVSDKLLNGFKLEYTGSASSVSVRCMVIGGM